MPSGFCLHSSKKLTPSLKYNLFGKEKRQDILNGKWTLEDRTLSQDSAAMARRELEHR
jgi:hypothetical protein